MMSEPKDSTIALNVRLKPSDSSAHPRAVNYTNVGMAQGMTFPRFHGHLYKEECDEIGGTNDHQDPTTVHGRI